MRHVDFHTQSTDWSISVARNLSSINAAEKLRINSPRRTAGYENDSWESNAIGWWGCEP